MEKIVGVIEFSDLDMKDFVIQKAKTLYGDVKIESSNYPLKYDEDGDPIYAIRITQTAS